MCRSPELDTAIVKGFPTSKDNIKSAIICVVGMGLFVATDTLSKVAVTVLGMPVLQMLALLGVGMVAVHGLVSISQGCGRVAISRRDAAMRVARVLLEVMSCWCFNLTLMHLPLANCVAVSKRDPSVPPPSGRCVR